MRNECTGVKIGLLVAIFLITGFGYAQAERDKLCARGFSRCSGAPKGPLQLYDVSIVADLKKSQAEVNAHAQKVHKMCEHCCQKAAKRQKIDLVAL
jgi:hypothetical protein